MGGKVTNVLIVVALFLVISGGFTVATYYILIPEIKEVQQIEEQIKSEEKLLQVLRQKMNEQALMSEVDTLALQHIVPIDPLIDKIILDLIEVEELSESQISSISISQVESTVLMNQVVEGQVDNEQSHSEEESNLHEIKLTLSVTSPNYDRMKQFIQGIEDLERTYKIDSLQFSGGSENFAFNAVVSTYFVPQFDGIIEKMPKLEFPEGSGKTIPLKIGNVTVGSE